MRHVSPAVPARLRRRHLLTGAMLALNALAPSLALAQTPEQLAARRALLDQATQARTQGHHADALDFARRAGAIHMSPSVRLFIAREEDAVGETARAYGDADACSREAERDASLPNRQAVVDECRALLATERSRIGYVIVRLPTEQRDAARVTVRDQPLDAALIGVPSVVTPGSVVVRASAPGFARFETTRNVGPGETTTIDVVLTPEPTQPTHTEASSAAPLHATATARPAPVPTHETRGASHTQLYLGIAAIALGGAMAAVGGGLYFDSGQTYDRCIAGPGCPLSQQPRAEESAAIALLWSGAAVAIVGGAVTAIALLRGQPAREHAARRVQPVVGISSIGVAGTF